MQVELEEVSPVLSKMKVVVPAEIMQEESRRIVTAYGKKAKIPGFRPGKAPASVVERRYAREIDQELLERVIPDNCFRALRDNGIIAVDTPRISDVGYEKGEPLSFVAMVEKRPKIELAPYTGIKAKRQPVSVTDEDVDLTLEGIRERMAEYVDAPEDHVIVKGDFVVINCVALIDGEPVEGSEIKDYPLRAGRPSFPEGLAESLPGAKRGAVIESAGRIPEGYTKEEIAGRECVYQAEIMEISKVILPPVDDELAKKAAGLGSVEALMEKIRDDIKKGKERDQDLKVKYQVMKAVCDAYSFDVPPSLLERELFRMIQRDYPQRNWDENPLMEAEFEAYREGKEKEAVESVRGRMVLEEIAIKERIAVTDADIQMELEEVVRSSGQPLEAVRKYYVEKYGSIDAFRGILALDKTMDFVVSKADIE